MSLYRKMSPTAKLINWSVGVPVIAIFLYLLWSGSNSMLWVNEIRNLIFGGDIVETKNNKFSFIIIFLIGLAFSLLSSFLYDYVTKQGIFTKNNISPESNEEGKGMRDKVEIPNSEFDGNEFKSKLRDYIFQSYATEKGVHVESTLSALGALSGFSLQQGIREVLMNQQGKAETEVFSIVETDNGDKYYFGSIFDEPLYDTREGRFSVWGIIAGGIQHVGETSFPDIQSINKENAKNVGTDQYGKHLPEESHSYQCKDLPIEALKKHWLVAESLLKINEISPLHWSWEIARMGQEIIILSKDVVPPKIAAKIFMESAISMSKVAPEKVINNN